MQLKQLRTIMIDQMVVMSRRKHLSGYLHCRTTPKLRGKRIIVLIVALALVFAGCANTSHVATHKSAPPLPSKKVAYGPTWNAVLETHKYDFRTLSCPSINRCIAGGSGPLSSYGESGNSAETISMFGVIGSTIDGGSHWTMTRLPHPVVAVACMSKLRCIAITQAIKLGADKKAEVSYTSTWVTTNSGLGWTREPSPTPNNIVSITCPSITDCIAVGYVPKPISGLTGGTRESIGAFWVSTNGGANWTTSSYPRSLFSPSINGISCPTASWCMVVGGDSVFITQDGGSTWALQPSSGIPGYSSVDSGELAMGGVSCTAIGRCMAGGTSSSGGNVLFSTVDGGLKWNEYPIDDQSVTFGNLECPRLQLCVVLFGSLGKVVVYPTRDKKITDVTQYTPGQRLPVGIGDELMYLRGSSVEPVSMSPDIPPVLGGGAGNSQISCPAYPRCYVEMPGNEVISTVAGITPVSRWYILRSG